MSGATPRVPLNEAAAAAAAAKAQPPSGGSEEASVARRSFSRKPFGAQEQKLAYPNRDGYHRHWFNDEPGRIERAVSAGYEQVKDPQSGRPISHVVGTARGGGALIAYLMEIPEEWYREDQAAEEDRVLAVRQEIERGEYEKPTGRDGQVRYAGSKTRGDISFREGTRR